jgi:hypothetical protein
VGLVLKDFDDQTPDTLFESNTLSSGQYNLAFNFTELSMSVKVGAQEFNDINIPNIQTYTQIILGNFPSSEDAFPDRIRNFGVDPLTAFNDIDWYSPELYMLRFNGNLNVSQKGKIEYTATSLDTSNNSIVTFNDASKPYLFVNDDIIYEPSNIPNNNYENPESIKIYAEVTTENAYTDNPIINNLYASSFNSNEVISSLSNFVLTPNVDISSNYIDSPYIIKSRETNVLAHDSNIGVKFTRGIHRIIKLLNLSLKLPSTQIDQKFIMYSIYLEQHP